MQDASPKDELGFKSHRPTGSYLISLMPVFPRILLLLVSSLSKGLQVAVSFSTVLELDQRQSCSLACPRGDPLQTSPMLGQKSYGPSSLGMGSHHRGSQDLVYPKKLFYMLKGLVPDFYQTSKSMVKPRTVRMARSRQPWRRNARDRNKPTSWKPTILMLFCLEAAHPSATQSCAWQHQHL